MSDIPLLFHSLEHDEPFKKCLTCNRDFGELDEPFNITKVFKGPECVFEYAICLSCKSDTFQSFSEESRKRLRSFSEDNPRLEERRERLANSQNYGEWTAECLQCGIPLSKVTDYSIACMGFGNHMVFDPFPMMVCSGCEQTAQKLLSKTTRDQWDKFIFDNFECPPADALKPDGLPMLV
jgi:hypothetical protein